LTLVFGISQAQHSKLLGTFIVMGLFSLNINVDLVALA
jgi:hypothetical protein